MARNKIWRHRVSPQAVFEEPSQEPAAAFLNRVGVLFYGTEWTSAALETLRSRGAQVAPGSDPDLAAVARDQVIAGLRSGRLSAVVYLTVAAWAHSRRDVFDDGWDELSDKDRAEALARPSDDPLIGENATPKQRTFTIDAGIWGMAEADISIDWADSKVTISTQHLRDESSVLRCDRPIGDFYKVQAVVQDVPLHIQYPFRALHDLVRHEELPDEAWFRRYKLYRDYGRVEALAAMWRYLAIGGFTSDNLPPAADLARQADGYLSGQGFTGSREVTGARKRNSGLEEMASLVLSQFRESNLSSSVLVSGNPRNRRPA
ncbi:hypothetical protein CLBKND_03181 [Methylorubrum aminovorans]